jgi:hypothetical protein
MDPLAPIEPDGPLDGLQWGCILRGALLDIVLTVLGSVPLTLLLVGPSDLPQDEEAAAQALRQAMVTPEGLFWSLVLGIAATTIGGWYGARRAGVLHVRHGGWVAVVSMVLGLPFYLAPPEPGVAITPLWYEFAGLVAMVPAGVLGGWIAGRTMRAAG